MPDRPPTQGRLTTTSTRTRRHARVAWGSICAFLSDWAVMAVPTRSDTHAQPRDYVTMARRVKLIGQHLQFLGVTIMLEEGRSWGEVADACGFPDPETAKAMYQEAYQAFAVGHPQPWASNMLATAPPTAYGDPDAEAARLDEWYIDRSHGDGSLVPGLRPVTDGLY